tara:strand:- start:28067 stop:28339 length:273 start_codon:yes stop_codon:yes gene_type:complete
MSGHRNAVRQTWVGGAEKEAQRQHLRGVFSGIFQSIKCRTTALMPTNVRKNQLANVPPDARLASTASNSVRLEEPDQGGPFWLGMDENDL